MELANKDLQDFLLRENALLQFMDNIRRFRSESEALQKISDKTLCTCNGYPWSDSPEGHDFWSKLDSKWESRNGRG